MEDTVKKFALAVLTLTILGAIYLYSYLGAYKPVTLGIEKRGPYHLLFKQHVGPYHTIVSKIQDVERWVGEHNLRCPQTFGEYLDNPEAVDQDRLRSHGGCVMPAEVSNVPPDFQQQIRPERYYAVAKFSGSPAIGPFKVYPKLREYMEEQRLKSSSPVIEIYTVNGSQVTTEYLFALDNPPPSLK
ncbi:MAG: GyrI-like domain-containing protein [Bdellovibrionales bacterium]|nr:GyrI-like domain-containing protein [Bdellovibrionales bacterium]